jgi:hypothetical protein
MIIPQNTTVNTSDETVMTTYGLRAFNKDSRPIVQNLGPGTLYLGTSPSNLPTVGIELPEAAVYELPATLVEGAGRIYLRAVGGDCDVRIINVG